MRVENRDELRADAATDIGDHGKPSPVVGGSDNRRNQRARRAHGLVEDRPYLRIAVEKFPRAATVELIERGPSGPHARDEIAPGIVLAEALRENRTHESPQRPRHIFPQAFACGCIRENSWRYLFENSGAFERAHQAEEARSVRLRLFGESVDRMRAVDETVGDLELSCDRQRAALPKSADDLEHLLLGKNGRRSCGRDFGHAMSFARVSGGDAAEYTSARHRDAR